MSGDCEGRIHDIREGFRARKQGRSTKRRAIAGPPALTVISDPPANDAGAPRILHLTCWVALILLPGGMQPDGRFCGVGEIRSDETRQGGRVTVWSLLPHAPVSE